MKKMEEERINALNSVTLAYVGDAVFSLFVRTAALEKAEPRTNALNRTVNGCVKAAAQSAMLEKISPLLSEREQDVVRRGRNCHTPAKAKNASLADYKRATALEALFGRLYLAGEHARLQELMQACIEGML